MTLSAIIILYPFLHRFRVATLNSEMDAFWLARPPSDFCVHLISEYIFGDPEVCTQCHVLQASTFLRYSSRLCAISFFFTFFFKSKAGIRGKTEGQPVCIELSRNGRRMCLLLSPRVNPDISRVYLGRYEFRETSETGRGYG